MRRHARSRVWRSLVVVILLGAFTIPAQGQDGTWEVPRTPWGAPDLQGIWTNATLTPVERPDSMAGPDHADRRGGRGLRDAVGRAAGGVRPGSWPGTWAPTTSSGWTPGRGSSTTAGPRSSWIRRMDVSRGPEAGRANDLAAIATYGVGPYRSWDDTDTGERCLTDGIPFVPLQGYNMNYHILQSEGWVVVLNEMFHEFRFIPTDGRDHPHPSVGQWLGDATGRWEGDTLVVETTNFADKRHYIWRATWRAARPGLRLVERFHPDRRADARLRVHDDGPQHLHAGLDRLGADDHRPRVTRRDLGSDVRVRLPRGELRFAEHPAWRPRGGVARTVGRGISDAYGRGPPSRRTGGAVTTTRTPLPSDVDEARALQRVSVRNAAAHRSLSTGPPHFRGVPNLGEFECLSASLPSRCSSWP